MGCRKFKGEAFFDDLTGETHLPEELEELIFVMDGQALAIHLDDENAEAFRAAMAPFVEAARPTSKAKVLATLPKRKRHLKVVPDPPPQENEPETGDPEGPSPHKGESAEALPEPQGLPAPESLVRPLEDSSPDVAARPALSLAPPPKRTPIPAPWAEFAPSRGDDKGTRVFKTRKWATEMGYPANETLSPKMFTAWEAWYREERWNNLE